MRWFSVFLCLNWLVAYQARSQTALIDSLRKEVYASVSGNQKLKALIQLFEEHQSISRDSLDLYGPQIKTLAERSDNVKLKSLAQLAYANWYFRWGWSDSALVFIEPEFKNNSAANAETRDVYFKLARAKALYLGSKSRYAEALEVLYKLLPETEKYKDTLNIGLTCNTIGSVALGRGQPDDALKWIRRSIDLVGRRSSNFQVLAPAYLNAGNAFALKGIYDSAVYYVQMALPLCRVIENLNYTATGLRILANVYSKKGNFREAEKALLEMLEVRRKTTPASILVEDNLQLADFYANSGQLEKAIQICLQNLKQGALTGVKGDSNIIFTNDPKIRLTYLEKLSVFYKKAGQTSYYLNSLEELVVAKDSFYEANSAQLIGELQTKYDVKTKENTILQQKYDLQRKNFLFYATVSVVFLLAIAAFIKFRNYRKQQQIKVVHMIEQERLHSLQAVKKAEERERARIAADLHDNLGAYAASMAANIGYLHLPDAGDDTQHALQELNKNASAIISQLNDTIWVLKKEALPITAISDRIKKFINQIINSYPDMRVDVHEDIDMDAILTSSQAFHMYRILQEAINNALKHSGGSSVFIQIISNSKGWHVEIIDNGIGLPEDGVGGSGYGMQNMRERCKEAGWNISWMRQKDGGTKVSIMPTTN